MHYYLLPPLTIYLFFPFPLDYRRSLYSQQKQHWELTVAQIMNSLLQNSVKLKAIGKTTRPFRYDLNLIPYDYTVEVTNRFKGIRFNRVPEELWMEVHDIVQETVIKTIHKKKKDKMAVEALQKLRKEEK